MVDGSTRYAARGYQPEPERPGHIYMLNRNTHFRQCLRAYMVAAPPFDGHVTAMGLVTSCTPSLHVIDPNE
jgi:hypothetical protein